jgi:hypothetical protein
LPYIKENWTFVNYCFGGVTDFTTKSEMGFIDVFYFFGLIGGLLFLWSYFKSYLTFNFNRINVAFLSLLVIIIFFAGNFFLYTTIPFLMIVLRERFLKYKTE